MKKIFNLNFWEKKNHPISLILLPFTLVYNFLTILNKTKSLFAPNLKIRVICVGNLYVGGTGKTPLVKKIYHSLKKEINCCIIKKKRIDHMDEINLLKQDSKIITPNNRLSGLIDAEKQGFTMAIIDDGMQDYRFKKDISILCIKSKKKFGNEKVLPSGPLRENLNNIRNYKIAVINGEKDKYIENILIKHNPEIKIFYSNYIIKNLSNLQGIKFLAFSGIADNNSFFDILRKNNINIIETVGFKDHHNFTENDLAKLIKISKEKNISLITTDKNYSNIDPKYKNQIYYTSLDLNINDYEKFLNEIN